MYLLILIFKADILAPRIQSILHRLLIIEEIYPHITYWTKA